MDTFRLTYPQQLNKSEFQETVAAIGFFDGIHRGHQKVIKQAIEIANEQGKKSAVVTFYPHPSVVLKKKDMRVDYLTPLTEKENLLNEMGIDTLYVITFNTELSKLEPQSFIDHYIIGLNIKHLVAGFDFSYGYKGEGSMDTIEKHARGVFEYTVVKPKKEENNQKISSTLIREHLRNGNIEQANKLLGRPLSARGIVVEGDKRGRTIGFPTANIEVTDPFLLPKVGVYAVTVKLQGKRFAGMANLGYKPTFKENIKKPSIEVHIFDYKKDIYGKELIVEWHKYIRNELKFNGIDELVNQIKLDEQEIRTFLKTI
ncbi:riboflavin biosynthesis protein RibF [Aquibacillus rhizosphaerae]|uniref:Riboflavin biosynthesis protein n=1 Tax=Aquibacillus rhizosphaerae TaxID=3051431 RepID=A0ABT7L405_9BACI|nr:riboflavin biosynthesis protein RibF [Aquibacillus sp. LR5S19]MDL4840109.1 riboflavin biosynthesis protein RibF [Aquibacillus sp. LR5S19]